MLAPEMPIALSWILIDDWSTWSPDNIEWDLELGFAHNNLGKLVFSLGLLDEAESHFREDLTIKERAFNTNTEHNAWRSYLGTSQYFLGQLLVQRGKLPEAETHLRSSA